MKWKNKGHEFDYIGNNFSKEQKIYIYGAGQLGAALNDKLKFLDCVNAFIDNSPEKIGKRFCGKEVLSFEQFIGNDKKNNIVVLAMSLVNIPQIKRQMLLNGYEEGKNLFTFDVFEEFYLPIFALYSWDKMYIPSISFLPTTMCNLNCRGCLAFVPLNKSKCFKDVDEMKKDIDGFFANIDCVGLFHFSGGEPFMYPSLAELVTYCNVNYCDKIATIGVTTNGTVNPSKELLKVLKKSSAHVWLDDYRASVELARDRMENIENAMREMGIPVTVNKVDKWMEISSNEIEKKEEKLIDKCNRCVVPYWTLKNQRLYGCNYSEYATEAQIIEDNENDYWDLNSVENKKVLLEFIMGYTDLGYYSFCERCNGYVGNFEFIPVAEQI